MMRITYKTHACRAVAAISFMVMSGLMAQSPTQGAITGTVFDATNAAVANSKVVIHNDGTNAEQIVSTDASGYYKVQQLDPGTYTVTVSAPGFSEQRTHNVTVVVSNVTDLSPH